MSWVTVIWSMVVCACLTLAGMHLLVWYKQRQAWAGLVFSITAIATAAIACCEFWMMRAATPEEFGVALRWLHVPATVIIISIVVFTWLNLRAGKLWLAWGVVATRVLALLLNFIFSPNLNYREIVDLHRIPFLGESVSIAVGVPNPWMIVGNFSLVLFVIFVTDATITVWRRGDRRRALAVGGAIVFFALASSLEVILVFWQKLEWPITPSLFFMAIVLVMALEMSRDALRATQLAGELRESEERLRLSQQVAQVGTFDWNIKTGVNIWTTELEAMYGLPPGGFAKTQYAWESLLHPDDRSEVLQRVQFTMRTAERVEGEWRVVWPDGSIHWISGRFQVFKDASGQPVRMTGVNLDITAKKQAEDKFRMVVEASPTGKILVDHKGKIVLINTTTEKLFGYSREELVGKTIEALVPERFRHGHPGSRAGFHDAPSARAMGVGRELFGLRKDGTEFPIEIGLSPINSADGIFTLTAIVDITARKKSEADMLLQRAEIAHLSRVAMLGELSGSIAHELNQPLTAILSNAQAALRFLALDPENIDEVRSILKDIVEDDKRAGEVIGRLRSLFKKEVRQIPLDVNPIVLEVLKLMHSELLNRNVSVHADLAAGLPRVLGDSVQLQQVLLNLIMNGCDAMLDVTADRRLTVRSAATPDGHIEVSVSDCGKGIPPADLERIFDPFVSTKTEGMGLGLTVCRTIISAHGGRLWATNNADRGASLHFLLPAEPS